MHFLLFSVFLFSLITVYAIIYALSNIFSNIYAYFSKEAHILMDIVSRIKGLCEANSITITELEREAGIGRSTIRNWNKSSPTTDKLQKVASYFDVSINYLLGLEDKEIPPIIRTAARDLMDLNDTDRDIAINMINSLRERGKDAKR